MGVGVEVRLVRVGAGNTEAAELDSCLVDWNVQHVQLFPRSTAHC